MCRCGHTVLIWSSSWSRSSRALDRGGASLRTHEFDRRCESMYAQHLRCTHTNTHTRVHISERVSVALKCQLVARPLTERTAFRCIRFNCTVWLMLWCSSWCGSSTPPPSPPCRIRAHKVYVYMYIYATSTRTRAQARVQCQHAPSARAAA